MIKIEKLFCQIVQIDSESHQEAAMSQFVQNFLRERKFDFSVDHENQILVRIPGEGEKSEEALLFCAHMDTVSPGRGIRPVIHPDGRITASGDTILGADNKASLASMLHLIDWVFKNPKSPRHTLEFFFTVREEVDDPGVKSFDPDWFKARVGFIFDKPNEPTLNRVVTRGSFLHDLEIEFRGHGAHASNPERGENTLEMFRDFITDLPLGRVDEDTTFNLGLIQGGEATNTVPSQLQTKGDYRSFDGQKIQSIAQELQDRRQKILQDPRFIHSKINIKDMVYCEGFQLDTQSQYFHRLETIYQSLGFEHLISIETQSASDGNTLNQLPHLTVFNCVDGCFDVHTVKEWTTVENLQMLEKICRTIAQYY
jgi:tripeptide aminopeptidase